MDVICASSALWPRLLTRSTLDTDDRHSTLKKVSEAYEVGRQAPKHGPRKKEPATYHFRVAPLYILTGTDAVFAFEPLRAWAEKQRSKQIRFVGQYPA